MQKQFSDFLTFFCLTKFSFAPILFAIITKLVSEDHKKIEKKMDKSVFFFIKKISETYSKIFFVEIGVKKFCSDFDSVFFVC